VHRALLAAVLVLAATIPAADAAAESVGQVSQGKAPVQNTLPPPDPLSPRIFPPASVTVPPPGFSLNAKQAIAKSQRTREVQEAQRKYGPLSATVWISPLRLPQGAFYHWDIVWKHGNKELVEVELGAGGDLLHVTKAPDIGWPLLLGFPGTLGGKLNAPYIWLPLCVLFLLPFFDPRRPFRLLHLDLLMLLLFGISHAFFTAGKPAISVPLVYPFLLYAAVRALVAGFRPRRRQGPLIPFMSTSFLIAGVIVLLACRIAFGIAGSQRFDVGTAGVIGADRIAHGLPLYTDNDAHGDTYGPVNYLMYVPFELAFPYKAPYGIDNAARAATIGFDVLMLVALVLLGLRLRAGPEGRRLAAGLGWAWVAFPYSALLLASRVNDAIVPLFVIASLIVISSPVKRGVVSALGTMTKFAGGLLAPTLATARGPFRWRPVLIVVLCYLVVCGGLILAFLPDGGLKEFWNTTLGFQLSRVSPLSLWDRHPSVHWMKTVIAALGILLAIAAAFVPRRRSVGQLAALCAGIFATSQLASGYWLYFYIAWFAPLLIVALFEEYRELGPAPAGAQLSVTSDFVKPEMISQPSSVTATRSSIRTPSTPGR
jgi:hypothetical protein